MNNVESLKNLFAKLTNKKSKGFTIAEVLDEISDNTPQSLLAAAIIKNYSIASVNGTINDTSDVPIVTISEGDIEHGTYLYVMYANKDTLDNVDGVSLGILGAPCGSGATAIHVTELCRSHDDYKLIYETVEDGSAIVPVKVSWNVGIEPFTLMLFKIA